MAILAKALQSAKALQHECGAGNDLNLETLSPLMTSKAPKELVIVKSHNPTPSMLHRMASYAEDLAQNLPHARLMISLDTTRGNHVKDVTDILPEIPIHTYDDNVLNSMYSTIPQDAIYPSEYEKMMLQKFHIRPSVTKHFQTPSQVLAAKHAQQHLNEVFDYVWLVEDDMVVCGDISRLMRFYHNKESDILIAQNYTSIDDYGYHAWPHDEEGSPRFKEQYPRHQRLKVSENMQRFSNRFLLHLDRKMKEHAIANSEMFVPTVAKSDGFVIEVMDSRHLGPTYSWNATVSKDHACDKPSLLEVSIQHSGKWL
eukprot:gnl/TRDRNA2_/TRDRNA2_168647_c0_seq4.p1 gnl/TRDRNA2_/TRDRNA2_168647_c0~~gnl/TRDRNA2_/TRDRNA2_168647_c0_seq4.p1  ORF type:complete len:313 (+),score=41.91 gnl/TRDRNA2_/TRDRNA2_168647_c0_seq4:41-979(+)